MTDHPISDPERYFAALADEQNALDDALAAIRDEQAAGRITAARGRRRARRAPHGPSGAARRDPNSVPRRAGVNPPGPP